MGSIANRSPWLVSGKGIEEKKFRLKSQANAYVESLGEAFADKVKVKQLETAFEVQITVKDKKGSVIKRRSTHSTLTEAKKWMDDEESQLEDQMKSSGQFSKAFETMTVREALTKCWEQYYIKKASADDALHRIEPITKIFGEGRLFRTLNKSDMLVMREKLKAATYSPSSIRNFFAVMSRTFQFAKNEWLYPVENHTLGIELDRPKNAKNRHFKGDERERLFAAIKEVSPWLLPIVELSLEVAFRRSELVQQGRKKREAGIKSGLMWEGVDFEKNEIRLFQEKNDWKKKNAETLGRTVPMPRRAKEILMEIWEATPPKERTGLVFPTRTTNSVTQAFKNCADKAGIENITFHTCRKVATYDLSKKVTNVGLLAKITGHKDLRTLYLHYYDVPIDDLNKMLYDETFNSVEERALKTLYKTIGIDDTLKFLALIKKTERIDEWLVSL